MCDRGYTLVGRGLSVCLSDFTWSSLIPTCRRKIRFKMVFIVFCIFHVYTSTIFCLIISIDKFPTGILFFARKITYFVNVDLYFLIFFLGNLPQISCTHRYAPRNGHYISSQARKTTWRMNDVATYQCRSGYVMSGDRSSQCLVSGHWSSDVPRCRRK